VQQDDAYVVYGRLAHHFEGGGALHLRQVLAMFDMPSERVWAALEVLHNDGDIVGTGIEWCAPHPIVITGVRSHA
jgi:hypothetical protein